MEKSAWGSEGKQGVDCPNNGLRVAIKRLAYLVVAGLALGGAVSRDALAELPPFAIGEPLLKPVYIDGGDPILVDVVALDNQAFTDGRGDSVEVIDPVAPQGESMTEEGAAKEGDQRSGDAKQRNLSAEVIHKIVLPSIAAFIYGLICGGAFGWPPFSRRRRE